MKLALAFCGCLVKGREESEAMLQVLSVNSQAEDFKALEVESYLEDLEDFAKHTSLTSMFESDFDMDESGAPPTIDGFDWVPVAGAKCSKGEDAGFYVAAGDSTKLVIYLQGGGGCANPRGDCAKRPADRFVVAPEQPFPGLIANADDDTFGGFTRVYVPYCTQDLWAGNHPRFFTGQANLKKFLPEMVESPTGVTEVLLSGTSAGGIGTLLNCNLVSNFFENAASKCAAIDGFFFPFAQAEATLIKAFKGYKADDNDKGPWSIVDDLVADGKLFIANSIFDPTQMVMMKKVSHDDVKAASGAMAKGAPNPFEGFDQLKGFTTVFGRNMVRSLKTKVPEGSAAGLFLMNCFNHAKSSKPGRVCNSLGGTQSEITVGDQTVLGALTAWYKGGSVRVIDEMNLASLNPTCPVPGPCDKRVVR